MSVAKQGLDNEVPDCCSERACCLSLYRQALSESTFARLRYKNSDAFASAADQVVLEGLVDDYLAALMSSRNHDLSSGARFMGRTSATNSAPNGCAHHEGLRIATVAGAEDPRFLPG